MKGLLKARALDFAITVWSRSRKAAVRVGPVAERAGEAGAGVGGDCGCGVGAVTGSA
ncbi:hypothetical protein MHIB_32050 [Mycolicibacter hiberniae]|uniref:Uncharacterized protein n=1 Tax=Mycolicibacter hiberniae TaxID=29314 RepID=A0A7I7X7G0_9MYCO|nr:hypothetical protein MHIB_32050 [Mycolicibacter hiberniae]